MEAVFVLGTLLFTVLAADRRSASCVPLCRDLAIGERSPARRRCVAFFAAIGLGFMLVETSQMQRLIVVLGHPTYGLTVVLSRCCCRAASAAALTSRIAPERVGPAGRGPAGRRSLGLLVVFGLAHAAADPPIEGAATPVRIAVSAALLAVPGCSWAWRSRWACGWRRNRAGADALALGRQRRHVGLRIGARRGHRAQHDRSRPRSGPAASATSSPWARSSGR